MCITECCACCYSFCGKKFLWELISRAIVGTKLPNMDDFEVELEMALYVFDIMSTTD